MAITRRQFVTRLGALAAVVGFSQADVSKLSEAFAGNDTNLGGTAGKPRVVWVHGAECTGCSTSLLGILESPNGHPIIDPKSSLHSVTTGDALGLAGVNATGHLTLGGVTQTTNPFTLWTDAGVNAIEGNTLVNIADVVIDVIDLQYHETVQSMGGDLAATWLDDFANNNTGTFILVVEGALQDKTGGGAWDDSSAASKKISWCSVGMSDDFDQYAAVPVPGSFDNDMPTTVATLAAQPSCAAVIPIGQCACFGGYPGCKAPITASTAAGFTPSMSQTGAMGVAEYLTTKFASGSDEYKAAAKVINVPGCPTNPWWFVMTVVLWMVDYLNPGTIGILDEGTHLPVASAVDASGRLKAVYPIPVHSGWCPRYKYYTKGTYAQKPGDPGCLQKLGCKGIGTYSLCGAHGWNNQQPDNGADGLTNATLGLSGGHCTRAGHPCMACTEKGYPDSFVPYVRF
jgi:hydrogenase small subunit